MKRILLAACLWGVAILGTPMEVWSWTEPRQLTDHLLAIKPKAVSAGRSLYVACGAPGGYDFYYLSSWNNGFSWSNASQPADTFYGGSRLPDIEVTSGGLIHLTWQGQYEGIFAPQIFHQSSSDGGRHWSNRHRVFANNEDYLANGGLASKGDTLFLAFRTTTDLLLYRSFDSGLTWQDRTVVDVSDNMGYQPTFLYSQGRLHLIYELGLDEDSAGYKIYYVRSDDLGLTWTERIPLSSIEIGPPFYHSQFPSAYADESGHIISAWFDYQYGSMCGVTGDILTRVSTDNGDSWLPEGRITYTQSGNASSCLIVDNVIYAAWADASPYGCDYPKIMISSSDDWGYTWSLPEIITGSSQVHEQFPFIVYSREHGEGLFHCFYDVSDPSYGSDLFYVRSAPFLSRVKETTEDAPVELRVAANPSLFNNRTTITYHNSKGDDVELEIFNVLGQRIWAKSLRGKEGNIVWDARDMDGNALSSGVYFAVARNENHHATIKIIFLK